MKVEQKARFSMIGNPSEESTRKMTRNGTGTKKTDNKRLATLCSKCTHYVPQKLKRTNATTSVAQRIEALATL